MDMIIDNTELLSKVDQELINIREIMDNDFVMEMFTKDFGLRFCWSSNAIEGNTLTLEETIDVIEYDEVKSGKPYSHYHQAKSLYKAISETMLPFHFEMITEEWIKKNNGVIIGASGEYKTKKNYIGSDIEIIFIPALPEDVPELMKSFINTVNFEANTISEVIEKVAKAHFDFERIHPFHDGNGRVGRMILNQQLINHGLLPITIGPSGDYRRSFKIYDKNGDTSKLIHEICKAELVAIERVRDLYLKTKQKFSLEPSLDEHISEAIAQKNK